MINQGRRSFFKNVVMTGAVLATSGGLISPGKAAASAPAVKGVYLRVPSLEMGADFLRGLKKTAPGSWRVHVLKGSMSDFYFETKALYQEVRSEANTFLGVADPAAFTVIGEAIGDSGGSFHYITYEDSNRVSFSVRL